MHHTVILSDIHLAEAEPGEGLWMRYRQRRFSPDREIAAMLAALRGDLAARGPGHALSLVLDGDVFDFDAPRVVGDESVFHDEPRDAQHVVPVVDAILRDNPLFVCGVAGVLADGHSVVFVSGNHDVQLTLPEVRERVAQRLIEATCAELASRGRPAAERDAASVRQRIAFRAWFHRTPDGVVIEHGNQYDSYCAYRYPMAPFAPGSRTIRPTMGSLATRLLVSRMGYFNPHVDSSFMLSLAGYVWHWMRYYALTRHSLVLAWAGGALRTIATLLRIRDPERRRRRRADVAACARETAVHPQIVARHARLFAPPAEDCIALVLRELWLDRAGLLLLGLVMATLWIVLAPRGLELYAVTPALGLLAYEGLVPKVPLAALWQSMGRVARSVAKLHHARAVVFGHTHHPEGAWEKGVFFGNTGSWSAAFHDIECTRPVSDERPLVWLSSDGGRMEGGLLAWCRGRFEPRVTRSSALVAGGS